MDLSKECNSNSKTRVFIRAQAFGLLKIMDYIKDENYIVIQGWMVTRLKLSGNNLLVYAIIYGFSQTQNQKFTGSRQYLADFVNSTRRGIQKNLDFLVDSKLLLKEDVYINNVKFCSYECAPEFTTSEQSSPNNYECAPEFTTSEQSSPNNIDIFKSKEKNIKKRKSEVPEDFKLSDELKSWAEKKFSDKKIPEPELEFQLEQFIDNAISKGLEYKDWDAAFRTWIRNSVKWNKINYENIQAIEKPKESDKPPTPIPSIKKDKWWNKPKEEPKEDIAF